MVRVTRMAVRVMDTRQVGEGKDDDGELFGWEGQGSGLGITNKLVRVMV